MGFLFLPCSWKLRMRFCFLRVTIIGDTPVSLHFRSSMIIGGRLATLRWFSFMGCLSFPPGIYTPPKFNSSQVKSYQLPSQKGEDHLPTILFQGRTVQLPGSSTRNPAVSNHQERAEESMCEESMWEVSPASSGSQMPSIPGFLSDLTTVMIAVDKLIWA